MCGAIPLTHGDVVWTGVVGGLTAVRSTYSALGRIGRPRYALRKEGVGDGHVTSRASNFHETLLHGGW